MSKNTKISWTDITWNMVWGCNGGCDYCYARNIARRFAKQMAIKELNYYNEQDEYWLEEKRRKLASFEPTYLASQSNPIFTRKPQRIFADSMSDIAFWLPNWIKDFINICNKYPEKTFQILTKFPKKLRNKLEENKLQFPNNVWLGITVETQEKLEERFEDFSKIKAALYFLSIEPIHGEINLERLKGNAGSLYQILSPITTGGDSNRIAIEWIIIGVETGNKKVKLLTDSFIYKIIQQAKKYKTPVFVKTLALNGKVLHDNLPEEFNYREFPKQKCNKLF